MRNRVIGWGGALILAVSVIFFLPDGRAAGDSFRLKGRLLNESRQLLNPSFAGVRIHYRATDHLGAALKRCIRLDIADGPQYQRRFEDLPASLNSMGGFEVAGEIRWDRHGFCQFVPEEHFLFLLSATYLNAQGEGLELRFEENYWLRAFRPQYDLSQVREVSCRAEGISNPSAMPWLNCLALLDDGQAVDLRRVGIREREGTPATFELGIRMVDEFPTHYREMGDQ